MRRKSPPRTKERAIELYGEDGIQDCPKCGAWYSLSAAVPCFACAVGLSPH